MSTPSPRQVAAARALLELSKRTGEHVEDHIRVIAAAPRVPPPPAGLTFTVEGKPAPQGSKRIGRNRATGQPILLDDNDVDLRVWRGKVRDAAWQAMTATGFETIDGPCMVSLVFSFARPKGHYGTGRNADVLRPAAPLYPAVKPDADKLIRAALDSMTNAAVFYDDSRVVTLTATKTYGTPGLRVHVEPIAEEQP